MPVSEITPSAIKIDSLIHRIAEGNIKVPAFQRGFVWTQEQIIALLDSIYNDYPVGSILLWNSNERLKATRNIGGFIIPELEPDYPINYVLDGQQRLSTIYAVFTKDRTQDPNNAKYSIETSLFDIYFDLEASKFSPASGKDSSHTYLNLNSLLNIDSFFKEVEHLSSDHRKLAQELYSRFINYELPIVTIYRREKDEVGIIFERINNTATSPGLFSSRTAQGLTIIPAQPLGCNRG